MDISFIGTKRKILFLTVSGVGGKVLGGGAAGVASVARGQGGHLVAGQR